MAHKINRAADGTWSFASNSEKAWHGLGQIVNGAMTAEEAIKLANLDYEVAKKEIYIETPEKVIVPDRFATYRTDTNQPLGVVGSRYSIVQNRDAFGFFDAVIDAGEAIFETAGALGNGERIFVTAKLPEDILVGGEKIEGYLLLTLSHDGTAPVIAGITKVRVVCNNTLQAALGKLSNRIAIPHYSNAKQKLSEAYRVMGLVSKYNIEVGEIFNQMVDKKLDEGQMKSYFYDVLKPEYGVKQDEQKEFSKRLENMVDMTLDFALTHPTQLTDEARGTLWGAYNAISGYYNYCKSYKSNEDKFVTQFYGVGNRKMLKSFDLAKTMLVS